MRGLRRPYKADLDLNTPAPRLYTPFLTSSNEGQNPARTSWIRRPGAAVRGEEEGSQARRPEERDQEVSEPGGGEFHPGFKAQGEAVDRVQVEVRPHPPTPRKTGSKIKTVRCLFTRRQVSKGRRQRGVFAFVTFLCFVSEAGRVERQFQRTFIFLLNNLQ